MGREYKKSRKKKTPLQRAALQNGRPTKRIADTSNKENIPISTSSRLPQVQAQLKLCKKKYEVQRRKNLRLQRTNAQLKEANRELKTVQVPALQRQVRALQKDITSIQALATAALSRYQTRIADISNKLTSTLSENRKLRKQVKRSPLVIARAIEKGQTEAARKGSIFRIMHKGIYTNKARAIARSLVKSGVSERKIGKVIQEIGGMMGKTIKDCMSQRTVQRVVQEGGVAANMQIVHEMSQADSQYFPVCVASCSPLMKDH